MHQEGNTILAFHIGYIDHLLPTTQIQIRIVCTVLISEKYPMLKCENVLGESCYSTVSTASRERQILYIPIMHVIP